VKVPRADEGTHHSNHIVRELNE